MSSLPNVVPRPACQRERSRCIAWRWGKIVILVLFYENTRALVVNIPYRIQHINARTPRDRFDRLPCSARLQERKLKVPFVLWCYTLKGPCGHVLHRKWQSVEKLKLGVVYARYACATSKSSKYIIEHDVIA